MIARLVSGFTLVAMVVATDQFVKRLVEARLGLGEAVEILPFLALFYARNEGIAFSMLNGMHGLGLAGLSAVVLAFVGWLWWNTPPERRLSQIGFAVIVGGALGNIVDRVSRGYVVDYILFYTPVWSFAIFNLADVFITTGAAFILLDEFVVARRRKRHDGEPT